MKIATVVPPWPDINLHCISSISTLCQEEVGSNFCYELAKNEDHNCSATMAKNKSVLYLVNLNSLPDMYLPYTHKYPYQLLN